MIKVICVKDYERVSDVAFETMKPFLKGGSVLGLATGSSPIGLYKRMIKDHNENGTSYKEIYTFNLDEYVGLPLEHSESYYTFMHKQLFDHIDIPEDHIHIPSGLGDLEANAKAYDAAMDKMTVDIQVLGIGSDGHIGFNEPDTPFTETTHVTGLTEQTRKDNARFFDPLGEEVPHEAITMGPANIMKAKNVLLVANGKNKAQAIHDMLKGEVTEKCPASILQRHPSVTVVVDEEAASLLDASDYERR